MKLIDVDSKATLEDFLTLKKTELVQLLRKCNLKISITKVNYVHWYYENTHLELFIQKCYKFREKYVLK
jgi:hypothetical protein